MTTHLTRENGSVGQDFSKASLLQFFRSFRNSIFVDIVQVQRKSYVLNSRAAENMGLKKHLVKC